MAKVNKFINLICLILVLSVVCALPTTAASSVGRLTVCLEDNNGNPINGLEVFICKIADLTGTDYYPAQGFENSGISISGIVNNPSEANAQNIYKYVQENSVLSLSALSYNGEAVFDSLNTGIYLVYCKENGSHSFNPYIVFLPLVLDGKLSYDVRSSPKTENNVPNNKSIYVVKKWDDKNNKAGKRPDSVTVDLKRDGNVVDTAVLNEGNGWSHTFLNLPDGGKYSVQENTVKYYSAQYNGDSENGFIITNTYSGEKLPQTGQLWWPIAVLAVAGAAFVLLGIIELGVKKNEQKTK